MKSNSMRILCVMSTLDRGGAESMVMNLYRHIDREKVQFDFVKHASFRGAFEDEIESLGGRIFAAPRYHIYNHFSYVRWWKKFFQQHPEYKVIHGHFFTISSIYLKVAKKYGLYTIGHSHCTQGDNKGGMVHKLKSFIERHFYLNRIERYSDFCFACSHEAGAWLFLHKPFQVLNNAIDAREFAFDSATRKHYRGEFGFSEDSLVLGTVGRIMHQKNPEGVIAIFEAIHKRNPKAKLLWVGHGPDSDWAKATVVSKGLAEDVVFTGVRSDVNRVLQAMDVFILPSFYEGMPVVAIEAQAAGLPTLCSDTISREAGITPLCQFLPLNNWTVWADAILKPLEQRQDMHLAISEADYDIHTTATWLENFYLEIVKKLENQK